MRVLLSNATKRRFVDTARLWGTSNDALGTWSQSVVRSTQSCRKPRPTWPRNHGVTPRALSDTEPGCQPEQDEMFMGEAIEQAKTAYLEGEVPVGAILVSPDGRVVSRASNKTETQGDPTAHAELLCIRQAAGMSGGWRLLDCTLYVTLEPCPMCAGAILQSRVGKVVYGARNTLLGADGSWIRMFDRTRPHPFHPNIQVVPGVREEECARLMKDFFRDRRQ